jgi:hypothetical protein
MKMSDILKKLGLNMDEEIDLQEDKNKETNKETSVVNKDSNLNKSEKKSETKDETKVVESDNKIKEDTMELKFDDKTGLFDLAGITDESVKAVLTRANAYTVNTANNVKINKAIEDKMASLKIRKGITPDAVRSLVKTDGIKVENDKVVGVDEAFENLQKEQAGLFVQRNQSENNPMMEGFNPVQNQGSNNDALTASLAALSASLSGSSSNN